MRFIDLNDNTIVTLSQIKRDWEWLREDDCENVAETFTAEIFEILLATINGRNDLELVDLTPRETVGIINRLRNKLTNHPTVIEMNQRERDLETALTAAGA